MSEEFPFEAPQVRILQPKLVCPIIFNGALCLEVLSVFGWSPSMSIDMLLHHIIDQLVIQKPKVESGSYTEVEAAMAGDGSTRCIRRDIEVRQWG